MPLLHLADRVIDEDGWVHTGDLGYFDDEWFLFIKGSTKEILGAGRTWPRCPSRTPSRPTPNSARSSAKPCCVIDIYIPHRVISPLVNKKNCAGQLFSLAGQKLVFLSSAYKSSCPPQYQKGQNFKSILSFVIKTKLVQNVNRMSERQKHRPTDIQTD